MIFFIIAKPKPSNNDTNRKKVGFLPANLHLPFFTITYCNILQKRRHSGETAIQGQLIKPVQIQIGLHLG